jgi:hypothetical protein
VRISVDPQFEQGVTAVEQMARRASTTTPRTFRRSSTTFARRSANGEMTGKGYQTALQAIRKTRSTLNDDVGGKAKDALDALESQVMDLGQRQNGQVGQDLATLPTRSTHESRLSKAR